MAYVVLIWFFGIVLASSIGITIYLGLFDKMSLYGTLIPIVGMQIGYAYLRWVAAREKKDDVDKTKLPYCWQKASELLKSVADSGDTIEWDRGFGRTIDQRTFNNGKETRTFYALYGFLGRVRQNIIVIWDVNAENIVRVKTDPSREELSDPFFGFKPFDNVVTLNQIKGMFRKNKKGGKVNIKMGERDDLTPDDDMVNSALGRDGDDGTEQQS